MKIFQLFGLQPLPAPADFRWPARNLLHLFLPNGKSLSVMAAVVHEYLGLAYLWFFPGRAGK
jgi:hypothetical protein